MGSHDERTDESTKVEVGRGVVECDTLALHGDGPLGLESHVVLQRARARLLGRTDTLARIGRYAVTHRLGLGGMGVVYAAHDPDLDRDVAIKVLRKEVDDDPVRQAWLLREAQALAKLNHPNVVHVYEVGKYDGHVFLAMELVEGRTLRAWVKAELPSWREIVATYIEAGRGLAAAHRAGVIHRDFKPDNVLVGRDARVRVLDFGLAGLDAETSANRIVSAGDTDEASTAPLVSGTPSYMAPEQHAGAELGPAADQFAFCVSLWEALCGRAPYKADSAAALAAMKREGPPSWPREVACARAVSEAVRRGLAPDVGARWASMDLLLRALETGSSRRRPQQIALVVGGVVLVASSALIGSWGNGAASTCTGADELLGDAWSAERRGRARQAFAATSLSYADRTWQRTAAALDAYAAEWVEQHTEACEATRVRGEQSVDMMDARVACLQVARRGLAATSDLLARADAQIVERADDLVGSLPELARCGHLELLLARIAPPAPEIADEIEAIRDLAAVARSLERAGKYEEADAALAPALERAARAGYEPVQTEILLLQGTLHERQGRYDEAEHAHARALQSSLRTGQWDEASAAATSLMMTVGSFKSEGKRGLAFAPTAWGVLARTANPALREAELRRVLGNLHRGTGDLELAEQEMREALALTLAARRPDDEGGSDALDAAAIHLALGSTLEARGKLDDAREQLEAAVAIRVEYLGPEHPRTGNARHNLAALHAKRGDFAAAEREYEAALDILVRAHGPRHPTVAMTRSNLAVVLGQTGRTGAAEAEKREVLAIFEEAYGPEHPNVASARQNLAITLGAQGKHAEAVDELRKVIAALEERIGARHPTVATVRMNLGMELADLGRLDDAAAELRAGLELRIEAFGETSIEVAEARTELARVLLELGQNDEARAVARASWTSYEQHADTPAYRRSSAAFMLARATRASAGDDDEARRLAEIARDLLEPASEQRAAVETWLREPAK